MLPRILNAAVLGPGWFLPSAHETAACCHVLCHAMKGNCSLPVLVLLLPTRAKGWHLALHTGEDPQALPFPAVRQNHRETDISQRDVASQGLSVRKHKLQHNKMWEMVLVGASTWSSTQLPHQCSPQQQATAEQGATSSSANDAVHTCSSSKLDR